MKRLIALILVVFISTFTLAGCLCPTYVRGDEYLGFEFAQDLNAKIESNELVFDRDNVVLDLFISVYEIGRTYHYVDDLPEIYSLAIYISHSNTIPFKTSDYNYVKNLEDVDDSKLIRAISYDEAFNTDFGYTLDKLKINYNHKEKVVIPEEFFSREYEALYIHIIELLCYDNTDINEKYKDGLKVNVALTTSITVKYFMLNDDMVWLI